MQIKPFRLERYFANYEFSVKYLLSASDCDGLPMSKLLSYADDECRGLWDTLTLGYTESLGSPLLRQEIASLYKGVSPNDIIVLVPDEGIFIAMNSILQSGDHVICTYPAYQALYQVAESLGCSITKWQGEEEKGWRFDPEFLRKSITDRTKLLVINFPHNPTGYVPSQKEFQEIIEIAREHNLYLFSDEIFRYLEYNPADRLPSAVELYEKAVSLWGMSKTFGLAGLRTGWVITKDRNLLQRMAGFRDYVTLCPNGPSEILAMIGLRAKDEIIADNLKKIQDNLLLLEKFFSRYSDTFSWVKPTAGTMCFPKLLLEKSATEFCRKAIEEAQITLVPSSMFGDDDRHIRFGLGRKNMPEAVEALSRFLEKDSVFSS